MKKGIWTQVGDFYIEEPEIVAQKLANSLVDFAYTGWTAEETEPLVERFIAACKKLNIKTYFCICVGNKTVDQVVYEIQYILNKVEVDGFVLDYIRYDNLLLGNIFGTSQITDKVRQIRLFLPERYELHAAVKSQWYSHKFLNYLFGWLWGVDYKSISKYLTAICPMVYTELYGLPQDGNHVFNATKWMNEWSNGKCQPILQFYYDLAEAPMQKPTPAKLEHEECCARLAGATAYSIFKYQKDVYL